MASCGVDVTAEIFRHAILPHDSELSNCSRNRLISALVATATASEAIGPVCEAREGLWDVICAEAPSFRPKGTRDAEVLEVLLKFGWGTGSKFCCGLAGLNGCTACGKNKKSTVLNTDPVIYYDQSVNGAHPGNLAGGLEAILSRQIDHEWQRTEIACKTPGHASSQIHIDGKIIMADHLMVSFGLSAQWHIDCSVKYW